MAICPGCGEENPPRFRLCGLCGTALVTMPVHEVRKTVTVVFSDLKGSTSIGEQVDSESLRELLARYFDEFRTVLERHGGTVEKFIGDAVMAVFGLPRLHEDDALRAVRAALEMQTSLATLNGELERRWGVRLTNRTGINTGEVVAGDPTAGQRLVTGDSVNVAARLEQVAPENEVLIGDSTYRLVKHAVVVEQVDDLPLKGKSQPVRAYRVLGIAEEVRDSSRRADMPIVGRHHELRALRDRLDLAVGENRCQVVTVLGGPGVGKSRLVEEFLNSVMDRARILRGRCLPYGEGITFWALSAAVTGATGALAQEPQASARAKLNDLVGVDNADVAERLAAVVGLSGQSYALEETFWATRRLLEILAGSRPVVLLFDDIHWAESSFLDLVEHLCDNTRAPVLLLCPSRHELLDDRPEWVAGRANAIRLWLEPLSVAEGAQIAINVLGTSAVPREVQERLADTAQGNPLFVEQTLSMLIDSGVLQYKDNEWQVTGDVSTVDIPPTISALISARLDQLTGAEQVVIERASVIGQTFYVGAVDDLSRESHPASVRDVLCRLAAKQLVMKNASTFVEEEVFSFRHILIRDSAYGRLLKRTRAELHERFVVWLVKVTGTRASEYEEIIGYHLEQAYKYLAQLGPLDARGLGLAARASQHLGSAGRRALVRRDISAATNLLERAVAVLDERDPSRLGLVPDLAEALIDSGDFARADAYLGQAIDASREAGDHRLLANAEIIRMFGRYLTDPEGWSGVVVGFAEEVIEVLEREEDHSGLSRAWRLIGAAHGMNCQYGRAEQAVRRAVEEARLAGDHRQELQGLPTYALSAAYGPTPVPDAILRCEEILVECAASKSAQALVLCAISHLRGLAGNFESARRAYRESRAIYEGLGMTVHAALVSLDSAPVEMLAGDPTAAEKELRSDYNTLTRLGDKSYLPTTAALLARALHDLGRDDEAEEFTHISEQNSFADDLNSEVEWRGARALILAGRGAFDEAEPLGRQGVALAMQSDFLEVQGYAHLDLAEVLALGGRHEEAATLAHEGLTLFGEKQAVAAIQHSRKRMTGLSIIPQTGSAEAPS